MAQILNAVIPCPQERMNVPVCRRLRVPDHVTSIIDTGREVVRSSQSAKVDGRAVRFPKHGVRPSRPPGHRLRRVLSFSEIQSASSLGKSVDIRLYIAPYAATAIAEFFTYRGQHTLVVYDDLTSHARAYRSLSLLLRRPPGREAFPGDVFYLHSRLLERATQLAAELGGGSLTALPIIETEAQNLAAYIPTNLISITDGQLYLSPDLFQKRVLPAVDVGKSVSRVGGKAQLAAYRVVAGDLKLAYSQFEELEIFSRFGTRLDEQTRKSIEHGNRIRACLKQNELQPVTVIEQITVLIALTAGLFDTISLDHMEAAEQGIQRAASRIPIELRQRILNGQPLGSEDRKAILAVAADALSDYRQSK
jgi:F-type H+-transporting ATPase subunit alpha